MANPSPRAPSPKGCALHIQDTGWRTRAAARAAPTISGRDAIEIEIGIGIGIEISAPASPGGRDARAPRGAGMLTPALIKDQGLFWIRA